ncbi:hypothetical protein EPR50_G00228020 [Scomber scombrus]|uniref:Uncharacterized protein n=1 Tax=Scomber scombrus TaxID=13677 RepID=A0AAV1NT51_SCOSC
MQDKLRPGASPAAVIDGKIPNSYSFYVPITAQKCETPKIQTFHSIEKHWLSSVEKNNTKSHILDDAAILVGQDSTLKLLKSPTLPSSQYPPNQPEETFILNLVPCDVERAFGIMKTRWRSVFLEALEVHLAFAVKVIAC